MNKVRSGWRSLAKPRIMAHDWGMSLRRMPYWDGRGSWLPIHLSPLRVPPGSRSGWGLLRQLWLNRLHFAEHVHLDPGNMAGGGCSLEWAFLPTARKEEAMFDLDVARAQAVARQLLQTYAESGI